MLVNQHETKDNTPTRPTNFRGDMVKTLITIEKHGDSILNPPESITHQSFSSDVTKRIVCSKRKCEDSPNVEKKKQKSPERQETRQQIIPDNDSKMFEVSMSVGDSMFFTSQLLNLTDNPEDAGKEGAQGQDQSSLCNLPRLKEQSKQNCESDLFTEKNKTSSNNLMEEKLENSKENIQEKFDEKIQLSINDSIFFNSELLNITDFNESQKFKSTPFASTAKSTRKSERSSLDLFGDGSGNATDMIMQNFNTQKGSRKSDLSKNILEITGEMSVLDIEPSIVASDDEEDVRIAFDDDVIASTPLMERNARTPLRNDSNVIPCSQSILPGTPEFLSLTPSLFNIVDVASNRKLFELFMNDWKKAKKYAISTACSYDEEEKKCVVGVAVCWGGHDVYYIGLRDVSAFESINSLAAESFCHDLTLEEKIKLIRELLNDKNSVQIAFDLKSHMRVLSMSHGIIFNGHIRDPQVGIWLLDPSSEHITFRFAIFLYNMR